MNRQHGAALVLVLWLIALMTALVGAFALSARVEHLQQRVLGSAAGGRGLDVDGLDVQQASAHGDREQVAVDDLRVPRLQQVQRLVNLLTTHLIGDETRLLRRKTDELEDSLGLHVCLLSSTSCRRPCGP